MAERLDIQLPGKEKHDPAERSPYVSSNTDPGDANKRITLDHITAHRYNNTERKCG